MKTVFQSQSSNVNFQAHYYKKKMFIFNVQFMIVQFTAFYSLPTELTHGKKTFLPVGVLIRSWFLIFAMWFAFSWKATSFNFARFLSTYFEQLRENDMSTARTLSDNAVDSSSYMNSTGKKCPGCSPQKSAKNVSKHCHSCDFPWFNLVNYLRVWEEINQNRSFIFSPTYLFSVLIFTGSPLVKAQWEKHPLPDVKLVIQASVCQRMYTIVF